MTTGSATVSAEHLRRAIAAATRVARSGAKEPVMQCVLLTSAGSVVSVVATDSLRLVVSEVLAENTDGTFTALVGRDDLGSVDLADEEGPVTLEVDAASVTVKTSGGSHTLPRKEGSFPRYEPYLERDPGAHAMVVDRAEALAAVEDQSDDQPLRLRFVAGALQVGELAPIRVAANFEGPPVSILLNPVFFYEALSTSPEPTVVIEAAGPRRPVVVRPVDEQGSTVVIMPMATGPQRRS